MLETVVSFLSEYCRIEKDMIGYGSNLAVDLGLNSLELAEMSCQLEERFDLEISEDALILFRKVGDISDYLSEHLT